MSGMRPQKIRKKKLFPCATNWIVPWVFSHLTLNLNGTCKPQNWIALTFHPAFTAAPTPAVRRPVFVLTPSTVWASLSNAPLFFALKKKRAFYGSLFTARTVVHSLM
ncbi:hypothetical protein BSKO_07005 [Bryopsis sp. KO-2023]|nr:hypothetical protein BSKO_07005 [Bryopsis sp. KO-2023]